MSAQRADARGFEQVASEEPTEALAIRRIDEFMDAIGRRPGTLEVALLDRQDIVVASNRDGLVGTRDELRLAGAALRSGREAVGHEAAAGDGRDYEFVEPVRIFGQRFAYVLVLDYRTFDTQLASVKQALILIGVALLGIGGLVFYLVGGRALMRSYRYALNRATRDGLTELPNQRAFQDEVAEIVATAGRHQEQVTLAILDVDDFKHINDRHGHPHGDAILRAVAAVLRDGRAGDRAFRQGGDEFAIIYPRTDDEGARALARRLTRAFAASGLKLSVGTATLRPGESATDLQSEADAALYEAKRHGGNQTVHFEDVRDRIVVTGSDRKDAVRDMIDHGRLTIDFQPIWDLESGSILALEALARPDDRYGLSGPDEAFDIAEQIGRVHDLDVLCVTTALEQTDQIGDDLLLFLNVHPQTLDLDADRNHWLTEAIERAWGDIDHTVIEVTERFGGRVASITKCLELLRTHGFKLGLDDVGTGNSGLEMLQRVQAEYVKIDGGIVSAAPTDQNARAVLMAMATYARQTGAFVIAEGIEDDETLQFLRHLETERPTEHPGKLIQGGQGFTLARPAPLTPSKRLARTPARL